MPFPESPQDPSFSRSRSPDRADGSPEDGPARSRSGPAAPPDDLASRAELKSVFSRALELSGEERLRYLADLAVERPAIADEIGSLLAAHERAGDFLDQAVAAEREALLAEGQEDRWIGRLVGPYRIVRSFAAGGMGAVYLAEREGADPRQEVAVKVVRRGLDSATLWRHFRAERQVLAHLAHPRIARFLDAGACEDGTPYLVMEAVHGEAIDRYCDRRALDLEARLSLFREVCSAVEHAHRHLVVHRDIKPANILVTAEGEVKLLDFGIAKLLEPGETTAGATHTAARFHTPDYASPEQIRLQPITTATDVYSLGVLLYRLVTGVAPYDLSGSSPAESDRIVCEQNPVRPSAAARTSWARRLRGDLDTILLMALRKEPARRYASVQQFSDDIRQFLEGRPVVAHRDTVGYRAAKFLRRNRVGAAAGCVLVLSLVGATLVTARQASIARAERDRARVEKTKAERINAFLQQMLASADPSWYSSGYGKRGDTRVVDVLKQAESRVDAAIAEYPEVRAELHQTIGSTYLGLGLARPALRHFEAALALYTTIYGDRHPRVAESLYYLGAAHYWAGDVEGTERLFRRSITIFRRSDPENGNLPHELQDLAAVLIQNNAVPPKEAGPLLDEAFRLSRRRYGALHPSTLSIGETRAVLLSKTGNLDSAERISRDLIEKSRRSNDRWLLSNALSDLGRILDRRGDYGQAEAAEQEALAIAVEVYGERHVATARIREVLSEIHCRERRYAVAEEEARLSLSILEDSQPDARLPRVASWSSLGVALLRTGRATEAGRYLREALNALGPPAPPDDSRRAIVESLLGECLLADRRYAEAGPLLEESLRALEAGPGATEPRTAETRLLLARLGTVPPGR